MFNEVIIINNPRLTSDRKCQTHQNQIDEYNQEEKRHLFIEFNKHKISHSIFINIQRIVSFLFNYSWLNTTNRQDQTYQTLKEREINKQKKMSKY